MLLMGQVLMVNVYCMSLEPTHSVPVFRHCEERQPNAVLFSDFCFQCPENFFYGFLLLVCLYSVKNKVVMKTLQVYAMVKDNQFSNWLTKSVVKYD